MKRGWTLLLASLMLAALLTACGRDAGNDSNSGNGDSTYRDDTQDGLMDGGNVQDGTQNGNGDSNVRNDAQNGTNGDNNVRNDAQNGTDRDDAHNGLDDAMRDVGDAAEDLLDDVTPGGTPQRNARRQTGPAWSGNLQKPDFPGGFNGKL